MTKQKSLILNIIRGANCHMTAELIFLAAKHQMPSIAVGTVYRNLKSLVESGSIIKIPVANAPDFYDKTVYPHYHALCVECGALFDIMNADEFKIPDQINENIPVLNVDLTVRCVCKNCRGKKSC